jgi:hypothetical protein
MTTAIPIEAGPPFFCNYEASSCASVPVEFRRLYLTLDVNTTNNSCNVKNMLFMDRNEPQYRETVSIALLSFAQGRVIDVYHDGSCCRRYRQTVCHQSTQSLSTAHLI